MELMLEALDTEFMLELELWLLSSFFLMRRSICFAANLSRALRCSIGGGTSNDSGAMQGTRACNRQYPIVWGKELLPSGLCRVKS